MRSLVLNLALFVPVVIGCNLIAGCSTAGRHSSSSPTDIGPAASVRVQLKANGLPEGFFQPGTDTKCSAQIIGNRFVVWLDTQNVAVGFNTSPNCRSSPDHLVSGVLQILVFDIKGASKAHRVLSYLADGNGEIVADGEAMPGPNGTLLVRIESVNLDPQGRNESKSGIRLLDADLKDVAEMDLFLEQTTFVDHDLVIENGSPFGGSHTYSILGGLGTKEIASGKVEWPAGAMDEKFGEHGIAFTQCGQELRPGEYTYTSGVYSGAKFRCTLNAIGEDQKIWSVPLEDGTTASIVGLLNDGSVAGQLHVKKDKAPRLVIWEKGGQPEFLPWLPPEFDGKIDTATPDLPRYATFATNDANPCNPIGRALGTPCDENGDGRWFVFDRTAQSPIVNRGFPKNSRAALAPDGLHYASFEANELRIYPLTSK